MGSKFFDEAMENSVVKAEIVSKYFFAWAKILSTKGRDKRVAYFDLYAGPGRYSDNTKSTPILVLEEAIKDPLLRDRLVCIFNDSDPEHAKSLKKAFEELPGIEAVKYQPEVMNEAVSDEMAAHLADLKLVPSFFFVDPFGYKGLSLKLIQAALKAWGSECVFFFNYNRINMGLNNDFVRSHMEALFGSERVDAIREKFDGASPKDRELVVIEELTQALKEMGGKFVLPFRFRRGTRVSHYLIHVSKNELGYTIMKGVMAKRSSGKDQGVANFEFSEADRRFPALFALSTPLADLEGELLELFAGRRLTMDEIFHEHHIDRPFIDTNYKEALRNLEAKNLVGMEPPATKRPKRDGKVTVGNGVIVTFPHKVKR